MTRDLVSGYIKHYIGIKEPPDLVYSWCLLYCHSWRSISPTEYRVPRNFKLLDELKWMEMGLPVDKYGWDASFITIGLRDWDRSLTHWRAAIIPVPAGYIGDRIYSLRIEAGRDYPETAPSIKFVQKVDMECVSDQGYVEFDKMNEFEWDSNKSLAEAIIAVREEMMPNEVGLACSKIPIGATYD